MLKLTACGQQMSVREFFHTTANLFEKNWNCILRETEGVCYICAELEGREGKRSEAEFKFTVYSQQVAI
jgi:hypothetical protein